MVSIYEVCSENIIMGLGVGQKWLHEQFCFDSLKAMLVNMVYWRETFSLLAP